MKRTISVLLSVIMVISCLLPVGMTGFAMDASKIPEGMILTQDTVYNVAPGITEEHLTTVKTDGSMQNESYVATIDFSNPTVGAMAGYMDYDTSGKNWGMQTVRDQAKAAEAARDKNIVVAMNADYFNMTTGEPLYTLIMNGKTVKRSTDAYYFAILKDGTPAIRYGYESTDDVVEAVGSPILLVKDNVIQVGPDDTNMPRAAIGITADGLVKAMVNDGRQSPKSVGYSLYDTARLMQALGCVDVLYLDGGGSATFCTKSEGTNELTVKNSPSDGTERKVSDTLFFYSTATPSGVFDHASLSPTDTYYTKTCPIRFSAVGVDSVGGAAPLPEDATFVLADPEFGTIDPQTGLFTPNGEKLGTVVVNLVSGGKTVGSTSVEIRDPDSISFINDEVSLGFADSSTLGLMVKYNNIDIAYTEADIKWNTVNDEFKLGDKFEYNGQTVIYYKETVTNPDDGTETTIYEEDFYYYTVVSKTIVIGNRLTEEEKQGMLSTLLGAFEGNTFISSEANSFNGYAVATSAYNDEVTGSIRLIIGKNPTVVMDFEDYEDEEGNIVPAADYWTVAKGNCDPSGGTILYADDMSKKLIWVNYNRGSTGGAEVVDMDNGEVRFDSHALRIDFDFNGVQATEGACIGFIESSRLIEGIPTGIGMWVYAPEGTPNLWMRIRVKDGDGVVQTVDFDWDTKPADLGINFTGWKYMEADLTSLKGPFSLIGGETIRPMWLVGKQGTKTFINGEQVVLSPAEQHGCIYIDNLQFVYGANTDDVDNPVIDSMQANLTDIENNMVIDTNEVSFRFAYSDVKNKYTTGINTDSIAVYVDGKNMTDQAVIMPGDSMVYLDGLHLANGMHTVKMRIRDNFNNETIETKVINVNGTEELTTATVDGVEEVPLLGKDYTLAVNSNNVADVSKVSADIAVDSAFAKGVTAQFSQGFEGEYTYDEKSSTVHFTAARNGEELAADETGIVKFIFPVPYDTIPGKNFTYTVSNGSIECSGDVADGYTGTFSAARKAVAVQQELNIEAGAMIVGKDSGIITVTDTEGAPVKDAEVFAGAESLGTTDETGVLVTDKYLAAVQSYSVYARKEDKYSFAVKGQSVNAAFGNSPFAQNIILNATSDPQYTKNITWLSSPIATTEDSVVLVAEKEEYAQKGYAAFKAYNGKNEVYQFLGSAVPEENYAVRINSAVVDSLKRDTEYVYKVGDGNTFSALKNFSTKVSGTTTNFFVIGDTQTQDKENTDRIFNELKNSGVNYDFAIQTGDSIESANIYADWLKNLELYTGDFMSQVDVLHVLGNHEYMGDTTAEAANKIYNLPADGVYSAQYGNVYVATMNYETDEDIIAERLAWIKEDSAKSNAQWKILSIHQPPYYTNMTSPSDSMNKLVPPALEEAGFDFVFSGHDHSYARTEPMTAGKIDEKNGIVYMISGTTGGKSYTASDTEAFNFVKVTNDFNAIYTTVEATEKTFTLKAYEMDEYGVPRIFDEYTKTKIVCESGLHTYILSADGYRTCTKCGFTEKLGGYSGFVRDEKTGIARYFVNGESVTDQWITNGNDSYYIGADGFAVTGENIIDGKTYTFADDGLFLKGSFVEEEVTMTDGTVKSIIRYYGAGGQFAIKWVEMDGALYHFKKQNNATKPDDGAMFYGGKFKVTTPGKNTSRTFTFDDKGRLIVGAFESENNADGTYKGTRYYWGDSYVTEPQTVDGITYTFDENGYLQTKNIEDCSMSIEKARFAYTGSKIKPAVTVKDGDTELLKGTNYTVSYAKNKAAGTATVTVTGNEKRGYSGTKSMTFDIVPARVTGVKAAASGSAALEVTWNKVTGATEYMIYRATTGGYKCIASVADNIYKDTGLKVGTTYKYKVKAVIATDSQVVVGTSSTAASAKAALGKTAITSATAKNYKSITLKWSKVEGATGYYVYRATSKNGTYKKIATVKGKLTYTDAACKTGTKYYYKVSAYATASGKTIEGAKSAAVSKATSLSTPKISRKDRTKSTVKIGWKKVSGASGYVIYRASKATGKMTKIATVKGGSKTSYTNKKLKAKTSYYYKVKAYRTVSGKSVYSAASSKLQVTTLKK